MADSPRLVSAATMAPMVDVQPATVLKWARDDKIPSVRISYKIVRFNPSAVIEALQNQDQPK